MRPGRLAFAGLLAVIVGPAPSRADEPILPPPPFVRVGMHLAAVARSSEAGRMLDAILSGSMMGGTDGWFGPGSSRYGYAWLLAFADANGDGALSPKELGDFPEAVAVLDRDGDGRVLPDDFDWSEASPFVRRRDQSRSVFRALDLDSNGKLDAEEWAEFYRLLGGEPHGLVPDDLAAVLEGRPKRKEPEPAEPPAQGGAEDEEAPPTGPPPGMPSTHTLVKGLFSGEVGSYRTGPAIGQPAPDFTLTTQDGKRTVSLHEFRGEHPVVLIFGSFT